MRHVHHIRGGPTGRGRLCELMIRPARAGNGGKHLIEDGKVLRDRPFHRKLRRVEHPDGLRFRIARFRVATAHVLGRTACDIHRLVVGRVGRVCRGRKETCVITVITVITDV